MDCNICIYESACEVRKKFHDITGCEGKSIKRLKPESTTVGKRLRILRIESDELMVDMAKKLGVSIAYLSAVELGKRGISSKIRTKLREFYNVEI